MLRYRDLLTAALAGEPLPVTPVAAWRHHPMLDQHADTLADAALGYQQRFDLDLVKFMPPAIWQVRDYGVIDRWTGDALGRREIIATPIASPDDWQALPRMNPSQGFSGEMLRGVSMVRASLPSHVPVLATVFDPVSQAIQLAGVERLCAHATEHPDKLSHGLSTLLANTLTVIEHLLELRVDGIFLVNQLAGRGIPAIESVAAQARADDRVLLNAAPLPLNLLHLHGPDVDWERFSELCSAVIHYDASERNPDPHGLQRYLNCPLATGPSPRGVILHGSASALMDEVMALRRSVIATRFLLAPGCTLPLAVPDGQLAALVRAARRPLSQAPS